MNRELINHTFPDQLIKFNPSIIHRNHICISILRIEPLGEKGIAQNLD